MLVIIIRQWYGHCKPQLTLQSLRMFCAIPQLIPHQCFLSHLTGIVKLSNA